MTTMADQSSAAETVSGKRATPAHQKHRNAPIAFFDGECTMCNAAIRFLMQRSDALLFAPLQGETAATLLDESQRDLKSLVLRTPDGQVVRNSTAVLRAAGYCRQPWALLARLGRLVPRPFRDGVYRLIAASRYRLFGKQELCRLPNEQEANRLLP